MQDNKYGLDLSVGNLWYAPFWQEKWFCHTVLISLLILLLILAHFCFRSSRPKAPEALILERINQLESQIPLISSQLFYLKLLADLKNFIALKANLELSAKTDSEIMQLLKSYDLDADLNALLVELLGSSTLTRFASLEVNKELKRQHLNKTLAVMNDAINFQELN